MHFQGLQSYVSKIRLKQGEYLALGDLANDVSQHLLPHFVAPPPKERDPEMRRPLTPDELVYETGRRVGKYWPLRPSLLDAGFLVGTLGEAEAEDWLPRLFKTAIENHALPIPVFVLADIEGPMAKAVLRTLALSDAGLAVRVTLSDLLDPSLTSRLHNALIRIVRMKPQDCLLILDFAQADLTVHGVHETLIASFHQVSEIGLWNAIIFQGTNYPETNPAAAGGKATVKRAEWETWSRAVADDPVVRTGLLFGDFAADSAKFKFDGKARTIAHYRYATGSDWIVVRGDKAETFAEAMPKLARKLLASGEFAGRNFSKADEMIANLALGVGGPGNATTWRRINTCHHITRVVADIGKLRGFHIAERASEIPQQQLILFPFNSSL